MWPDLEAKVPFLLPRIFMSLGKLFFPCKTQSPWFFTRAEMSCIAGLSRRWAAAWSQPWPDPHTGRCVKADGQFCSPSRAEQGNGFRFPLGTFFKTYFTERKRIEPVTKWFEPCSRYILRFYPFSKFTANVNTCFVCPIFLWFASKVDWVFFKVRTSCFSLISVFRWILHQPRKHATQSSGTDLKSHVWKIKNSVIGDWHLALAVKVLVQMPAFCIRMPGFRSQLCSQFRLPVNVHPDRQKLMAQVVRSLPPR